MDKQIAARIADELADTNELLRGIQRQLREIRASLEHRRAATISPRAATQPQTEAGSLRQLSTPSLWRFK